MWYHSSAMPLLEVEGLSVSFGGLAALSHVSLGAERGEIVGLIGPNGAGKTTLFNAITGFVRPTGGEIRFKGEPITGWPSHRICWRDRKSTRLNSSHSRASRMPSSA